MKSPVLTRPTGITGSKWPGKAAAPCNSYWTPDSRHSSFVPWFPEKTSYQINNDFCPKKRKKKKKNAPLPSQTKGVSPCVSILKLWGPEWQRSHGASEGIRGDKVYQRDSWHMGCEAGLSPREHLWPDWQGINPQEGDKQWLEWAWGRTPGCEVGGSAGGCAARGSRPSPHTYLPLHFSQGLWLATLSLG